MIFIFVDIMSDVGWMFQKRANEPTTESPEGKRTCLVSQTGEKTQELITPYIKTLFVNTFVRLLMPRIRKWIKIKPISKKCTGRVSVFRFYNFLYPATQFTFTIQTD